MSGHAHTDAITDASRLHLVDSMQIEHDQVEEAKAGDAIGIKVRERCRDDDVVYKIS